jgi:uncharacterized protein YggE
MRLTPFHLHLEQEEHLMPRFLSLLVWLPLCATGLLGQNSQHAIQATGSATIPVNPDQAKLAVGVVTQGATAQDAGQQNATLTTTVLNALKGVLGTAGSIQTISYSISPRYSTTQGQPSVIIGYTASNTVEVTTTDLSIIGRLIDTANQAGANSVGNLSFGLQNPEPYVEQALGQAAKQAQAHANAIATGLGAKTGVVMAAQEGSSVTPILAGGALAATSTPILTGTVSVSANVTISVQLIQ